MITETYGRSSPTKVWKPKKVSEAEAAALPSLFAASFKAPRCKTNNAKTNTATDDYNVSTPPPVNKPKQKSQSMPFHKTSSRNSTSAMAKGKNDDVVPSLFQSSSKKELPHYNNNKSLNDSTTSLNLSVATPTTVPIEHEEEQRFVQKKIGQVEDEPPMSSFVETQPPTTTKKSASRPSKAVSMPVTRKQQQTPSAMPLSIGFNNSASSLVSPIRSPSKKKLGVVSPYSHGKAARIAQKSKKHWLEKSSDHNKGEKDEKDNNDLNGSASSLATPMSHQDQTAFVQEHWALLQQLLQQRGPPPVELLNLEESESALMMLKHANWDNESVSSEAERLDREQRVGKGQTDEKIMKEKMMNFFSNHGDDDSSLGVSVDSGYHDVYDSDASSV